MKTHEFRSATLLFTLLFFVFFTGAVSAQEIKAESNDTMWPEYPGGINAFSSYLLKNINPDAFHELSKGMCSNRSKFYFEFSVTAEGTLSDIRLLKPADKEVESEVRRVMLSAPKWKPCFANGKAIKTKMRIPLIICYQ